MKTTNNYRYLNQLNFYVLANLKKTQNTKSIKNQKYFPLFYSYKKSHSLHPFNSGKYKPSLIGLSSIPRMISAYFSNCG